MLRLKKRHTENIIKEYIKVIKLSDYMLKWNGKEKEYIKIHNHSIGFWLEFHASWFGSPQASWKKWK